MPGVKEIVNNRHNSYSTIHRTRPVHLHQIRIIRDREECKYEGNDHVGQANNVAKPSERNTQAPAAWQQLLPTNSFEKETSNRSHVRGQKRADTDGQDGIESNDRAKVDQGQKRGASEANHDRVQWNIPTRSDVGKEAFERQPTVSRERIHLSTCRGNVADGRTQGQRCDDTSHDRCSSVGLRCVVEGSDERKVIFRLQCSFDRSQAVCKGDGHDQAGKSVEDKS